jgi:hypothetical protein
VDKIVWLMIVSLLVVVNVSGCSTSTTSTTTTTLQSYFPLITGHVLTYEVVTESPVDPTNPYSTYETSVTYETWRISNGPSPYKTLSISDYITLYPLFREDASGVYNSDGANPEFMYLKYPLTIGSTWESGGIIHDVYTEEAIVTHAGTFTCRTIQRYALPFYEESYSANVGFIRSISSGDFMPVTVVTHRLYSKNF